MSTVLFFFFVLFHCVLSDLPIHCLNEQIAGKWKFLLSADTFDKTESCGYQQPDSNAQHFTQRDAFNFPVDREIYLTLTQPNIAITDTGAVGTWTMVYDEGFEVSVDNYVFFAFSKYKPREHTDLSSMEVRDYISICHETMVGWYHSKDAQRWGCFQGKKKVRHNRLSHQKRGHDESTDIVHYNVVSPIPKIDTDDIFEPNFAFVESVNRDTTSTWQATVHKDFVGKRVSEMLRLLGRRFFDKGVVGPSAVPDSREDKEKYGDLPTDFSWTNYNGANFDSPVRNQGQCGSCFVVAAIYMLETRLRIKTGNAVQTQFSLQDVVSCSRYNQGCDGGYPILVGKHGEEFGFVPESCFPYEGASGQCSQECQNAERLFVTNHAYVGGYYGGCSEVAMMKEIFRAGPIVIPFQAPASLFYYSGGIFTGPSPKSEGQKQNGVNPWEQTNHAVTAIGWGVEPSSGIKYWVLKNTWGNSWGENGYFRIRRGTDECGCESMASSFDVVLPSSAL